MNRHTYIILAVLLVFASGCIEKNKIYEIDLKKNTEQKFSGIEYMISGEDEKDFYMKTEYGQISIKKIKNPSLMHIQLLGSEADYITTPVLYIQEDMNFEKAEIQLKKNGFVNRVFYCDSSDCKTWKKTGLKFEDRGNEIYFVVNHFTAYAGGIGYESQLVTWDQNDTYSPALINEQIYFYANYTNTTGNDPVLGNCSVRFNTTSPWTDPVNMTYNSTSKLYEYNKTFSVLANTTFNITCNASEYELWSANDTVKITELGRPILGILNIETFYNSYVNETFNLSVTASDEYNISACYYTVNGNTWANAVWTNTSCVKTGISCSDGQSLSLGIKAVDSEGNENQTSIILKTCDAALPIIISVTPASNACTNNTIPIHTVIASDTQSSINTTSYEYTPYKNGSVQSIVTQGNTYTWNALNHGESVNVTVRVKDFIGHWSSYAYSGNYTVDLTGSLSVTGLNPANNTNTSAMPVLFSWSMPNDIGCNNSIGQYNFTIFTDNNCITTSASYLFSQNSSSVSLSEGEFYWRVKSYDGLNNSGDWSNCTKLVIDRTDPAVSIKYPGNITYENGTLKLNFTIIESSIDRCWYSLNNNENITITSCVNGTEIISAHGYNNITLWINDTAGNTGNNAVFFIQNNVSKIIDFNATNGNSEIISSAANPLNNNSYVNFSVLYNDADNDNTILYVCRQNNADKNGCIGGEWCTTIDNTNPKHCTYNIQPGESSQIYNYFIFMYDSYNITNSSGTFHVNHIPYINSIDIVPSTAYETGVLNCTNTSSDADSDSIINLYKWYVNGSEVSGQTTRNLTGTYFNHFDNVTCQITPVDEHNYQGNAVNSSALMISNTLPVVASTTIAPATAYETTILNCTNSSATDADNDTVTLNYKWYKNSDFTGQITWNLTGTYFNHFDNITCGIIPYDSYNYGNQVNSSIITILNTVPVISSIAISPAEAYVNSTLNCTGTYSDVDNDDESGSMYKWYVNGTVVAGADGKTLQGVFQKHNNVSCEYSPKDNYDYGAVVNSSNITILNSRPIVTALNITPVPAYETTVLNCTNSTIIDRDNDAVTLSYKWHVNSTFTSQTTWNLTGTYFNHFDNVTCEIKPNDSEENGNAVNSSILMISNTPPVAGFANITPKQAYETTVLNCTNGSITDADNDTVTLNYKWYKNSDFTGQITWNLTGTYFNHFDNITCGIIPYDSYNYGNQVNSSIITILNTVPVISSIAISPAEAYVNSTLNCTGTYSDVDNDDESGSMYKWYVNGSVNSSVTTKTFENGFVKHNNVSCEYSPKDNYDYGAAVNSSNITILNSRPIVTALNITPVPAYETTVLNCTNSTIIDRDNDAVTLYYKWHVNSTFTSQTTWNLTGTYFNHFDNVTCEIKPNDSEENGNAVNSSVLIISNTPPVVGFANITPKQAYETTVLNCTNGSITDADNDTVTLNYKWYKNSDFTEQTTWNLTGTYFNHFENMICGIIPYDSYNYGNQVNSSIITILNTVPVISNITISPAEAYVNSTLNCTGTYSDVDNDDESGSMYKWYVNGSVNSSVTTKTFENGFVKHNNVSCEYSPKDNYDYGAVVNSSNITILNSRPIILWVNITPEASYETSTLTCFNGTVIDRDNDAITVYYNWTVNLTRNSNNGTQINGTFFNHFDNVTCYMTAFDTEENGTANNKTTTILNTAPYIHFFNISRNSSEWKDEITFLINLSDIDNDNINASLYFSHTNITWSYQNSTNCTACFEPILLNVSKYDFTCSDIGQNYFYFNVTDHYNGKNSTNIKNSTLEKVGIPPPNIQFTDGAERRIGTRGTESLVITSTFYDPYKRQYIQGVNGSVYILKNDTFADFACMTNSFGNCTISFDPTCEYYGDLRILRAGIRNDACYKNVNSTDSYIIIDLTAECLHKITLRLSLNKASDLIKTSLGTASSGNYTPDSLDHYYICEEDLNQSVLGIIFAGKEFSHIEIKNRELYLSQYQSGNKFIIPITGNGCSKIKEKIGLIENNQILTQAFNAFTTDQYPTEIILPLKFNLNGESRRGGSFILVLEKIENNTITAEIR